MTPNHPLPENPESLLRQTRALALAGLLFGVLATGLFLFTAVTARVAVNKTETEPKKDTTQDVYTRSSNDFAYYTTEHNIGSLPVDYADPVLNKQRTIFLNGAINNLTVRNVIAQLFYLNAKNPSTPINLYLTTSGGDSDCAFALLDTMQVISAPVNVWALGGCHSSGAMILVGATGKRYATPSSIMMVHANSEPSKNGEDKNSEDYDLARLQVLWRSRSHIPAKWFPLIGDKEYYMTAKEALDYGVIDVIKATPRTPFAPK